MAKLYLQMSPLVHDPGYAYVPIFVQARGIEAFENIDVWLPLPGEPAAPTIKATALAYVLTTVNTLYSLELVDSDVVIFGEPT